MADSETPGCCSFRSLIRLVVAVAVVCAFAGLYVMRMTSKQQNKIAEFSMNQQTGATNPPTRIQLPLSYLQPKHSNSSLNMSDTTFENPSSSAVEPVKERSDSNQKIGQNNVAEERSTVKPLDLQSRPPTMPVTLPSLAVRRNDKASCVLVGGVPRKDRVYLTIGVPTVKRLEAEYVYNTLASLLEKSSPEQQQNVTIIIMLADRDQSHNEEVLRHIQVEYPQQLQSGLIIVALAPNTEFIFTEDPYKRTYNDSVDRIRWRSKQNLDYAALMEYATNYSTFYMQLEDDVLAAQHYIQKIRDFIDKNTKKNPLWVRLDFSPHGFIGKLFKTLELPKLVTILRTFYLEQPCDILINSYHTMMVQKDVILRRPSLFYHQGYHSSLTNIHRFVERPLS